MREIRFRAWYREDKQMFQNVGIEPFWVEAEINDNIVTEGFWGKMITVCQNGGEIDLEVHDFDVELMQYTGLKDKNGKEIFEGDIVKTVKDGWAGMRTVEWCEIECGFLPKLLRLRKEERTHEIIGNIYENPELIGKEE